MNKHEIKIIGPQQGVAQEPKIGDYGYFWDEPGENKPFLFGELESITDCEIRFKIKGGLNWMYFSRTLPDWFPVIRDLEKPKPIEVQTEYRLDDAVEIRLVEPNYDPNVHFKDLILIKWSDGEMRVFMGNWNSGTL
jgi:hypothetical protein